MTIRQQQYLSLLFQAAAVVCTWVALFGLRHGNFRSAVAYAGGVFAILGLAGLLSALYRDSMSKNRGAAALRSSNPPTDTPT